jgi:hypothetical protein
MRNSVSGVRAARLGANRVELCAIFSKAAPRRWLDARGAKDPGIGLNVMIRRGVAIFSSMKMNLQPWKLISKPRRLKGQMRW